MRTRPTLACLGAFLTIGLAALSAEDWPEWRGKGRVGIWNETGILEKFPEKGLKVLWRTPIKEGYAGPSVADGRVFITDFVRAKGPRGTERVFCLDEKTGRVLWLHEWDADYRGIGWENGTHATPTVDGDRVYVLGSAGMLLAFNVKTGDILWKKDYTKDYGADLGKWGISGAPLVDGERLICIVGGEPDAKVVALDKMTGKTVWTSTGLSDQAGYASCVVADVQGVRTVMTLTADGGVGVRASDGKLMWKYHRGANDTANIATPIFHDNKVFYASSYGTGGALLELTAQSGEVKTREVYFTREMQNHHGGVVLVNGYLYGFNNSILTCLEFATGKMMWRHRSVGKGSLTYADGNLYIQSEDNVVGLAEASPAGYREKGRFSIPDQGLPSWAHPVVCGGKLYLRSQAMLMCYNLRR